MTTRKLGFSALIITLLFTAGCATTKTPTKDTPAVCALKGGAILGVPGAAYNMATGGTAFFAGAVIAGTACALTAKAEQAVAEEAPAVASEEAVTGMTETTIHFDFDSSTIKTSESENLNKLLGQYARGTSVMVTGHTCDIGTEEYNQGLSERRAMAVKKYLEEMGVPEDKIKTEGKGESSPVRGNETDDMRQENRRAEVRLSK